MRLILIVIFCTFFTVLVSAQSSWELRIMPQIAFGTKNTVQRPNDNTGTRVDLDKEFKRKNCAVFSPRLELEYTYKRNHFIATATFLQDKFEGISSEQILFNGKTFATGSDIHTTYNFNTYRLGYRYRFVDNKDITFEAGATVLLRDAYIKMSDSTLKTRYSNVGAAPLLSYMFAWHPVDKLTLLSYGDGFAVKVGRAFDIFAGAKYQITPLISASLGYRLLEGGSDADRIYTMSTFHYISSCIGISF